MRVEGVILYAIAGHFVYQMGSQREGVYFS